MGRKPKVVVWTAEEQRSDKRRIIIYGVAFGVILLLGLTWWVLNAQKRNNTVVSTIPEQVGQDQINDAMRLSAMGDSDAVLKQTNQYLKQNLEVKQRVALLQQRAGAYQQKGDIDNVLKTYQECERLEGDNIGVATAQGMASVYQERGDKPKAAYYLRKLITATRATKDPVAISSIPMYEEIIRSLGEQP